jgi:SAM-dependent methyltransferase
MEMLPPPPGAVDLGDLARLTPVSDVFGYDRGNPVDRHYNAGHIASHSFDCVIITQTLHLILDAAAAVRTVHRILRPGGVMLATLPGISQISRNEWRESWYWSFTELSAGQVFGRVFGCDSVCMQSHGNVLAATAFLQGLASRELRLGDLECLRLVGRAGATKVRRRLFHPVETTRA